jgi:hypothetical protein
VRLVDCCREEMRADLRGEKGSQESQYPNLGVLGVWTLPGGEGVATAKFEAIVSALMTWSGGRVWMEICSHSG